MPRILEIHYRKLIKVFEIDGWKFHHQTGSHLHLIKPGYKRPVTIPTYKSVPVFIPSEKTMAFMPWMRVNLAKRRKKIPRSSGRV